MRDHPFAPPYTNQRGLFLLVDIMGLGRRARGRASMAYMMGCKFASQIISEVLRYPAFVFCVWVFRFGRGLRDRNKDGWDERMERISISIFFSVSGRVVGYRSWCCFFSFLPHGLEKSRPKNVVYCGGLSVVWCVCFLFWTNGWKEMPLYDKALPWLVFISLRSILLLALRSLLAFFFG
ncbi:hypothetical protein DL98DRAFT_61840 [Cadophora sp. DSE1049]|nr:hypothetical protein DL98DRAFT_61840 [Cadophora sp. DSE1049]